MKNILLSLLLVASMFSLQATCNKEEPRKLIPNDSTFLSYWYFPKDSYWIYKDSASNQRDTFLVESVDIQEEMINNSNETHQFHVFRVINKSVLYIQVGRPSKINESSYYYIVDQRWDAGNSIRFFYDPINKVKNLSNTLIQLNIYDSLIVRQTIYYNVIHMLNYGQGINDMIRQEYYAKDIGIIKRIDKYGVVWNLESYSIAK